MVTGGFPHKGPITQKMFPFDDVIMCVRLHGCQRDLQDSLCSCFHCVLVELCIGWLLHSMFVLIFKQILVIDQWGISYEIALIWMALDFADDQSTLVQVMAWCRQATSHYLNQCWPRSLSPYGVTRPQWVKAMMRAVEPVHNKPLYIKIIFLQINQ